MFLDQDFPAEAYPVSQDTLAVLDALWLAVSLAALYPLGGSVTS